MTDVLIEIRSFMPRLNCFHVSEKITLTDVSDDAIMAILEKFAKLGLNTPDPLDHILPQLIELHETARELYAKEGIPFNKIHKQIAEPFMEIMKPFRTSSE